MLKIGRTVYWRVEHGRSSMRTEEGQIISFDAETICVSHQENEHNMTEILFFKSGQFEQKLYYDHQCQDIVRS